MNTLAVNAATLERELAWADAVINASICLFFGGECAYLDVQKITAPDLQDDDSTYARTVKRYPMTFEERLVLILALIPHLRPQLLDVFLIKNELSGRGFAEFGGADAGMHSGFWPSVQTAAFILAGNNLAQRLSLQALFGSDHFFRRDNLLEFDAPSNRGLFSVALTIGAGQLDWLTRGQDFQPSFSSRFPAKRLTTTMQWSDLVLDMASTDEVEEIRSWITLRATLTSDGELDKHIKPGFVSVFYGPPGTGKTLTAALLGKSSGSEVYRVDLRLALSKLIGETERNLGAVFDRAERNNWILFFDQADTLFATGAPASNSHDRCANQGVAYLLQRLQDFPGLVILTGNLTAPVEVAFSRRFQSIIHFPMPGKDERLQLWRNAFAHAERLDASVDLACLADEFELAGGAIVNVLRSASLMALRRGGEKMSQQDIRDGIGRELRKEEAMGKHEWR